MTLRHHKSATAALFLLVTAPFGCADDANPTSKGGPDGGKPSHPGTEAGTDGGGGSTSTPDGGSSAPDSGPSGVGTNDGGIDKGVGDGGYVACVPDESAPVPADRCIPDAPDGSATPACNTWQKVVVPGAVCSDGSPYKIFVNYSNTSNDLVVSFEPGGACWDYESCSGAGGIRGAANPNGIPDDHMATYQYLNLLRRTDDNPVKDYNMVFVSYCTGDVHTGNKVATYTSSDGKKSITFRHNGHANSLAVVDWINKTFKTVPKMLATGCSAGGAGSLLNYLFLRDGVKGAQCGYLLDDSGPIFHSNGPSAQLDQTIRAAWNTDTVLDELQGKIPIEPAQIKADYGLINVAVAKQFPHDRLALTAYREDFNYSLYSYQRFFPGSTEAEIHAFWWQDMTALIKTFDGLSNFSYYIPYFRADNCSHCVSIPPLDHDVTTILTQPWLGSEIPQDHIDLKGFTANLMDDTKPLMDYVQAVQPNESFTPAESASCMAGGTLTSKDQ